MSRRLCFALAAALLLTGSHGGFAVAKEPVPSASPARQILFQVVIAEIDAAARPLLADLKFPPEAGPKTEAVSKSLAALTPTSGAGSSSRWAS